MFVNVDRVLIEHRNEQVVGRFAQFFILQPQLVLPAGTHQSTSERLLMIDGLKRTFSHCIIKDGTMHSVGNKDRQYGTWQWGL